MWKNASVNMCLILVCGVGQNGAGCGLAGAPLHGEARSIIGGQPTSELHKVRGRPAMEHGALPHLFELPMLLFVEVAGQK